MIIILRLCYVVVVSLPFVMYYMVKAKVIERCGKHFPEERRYRMAQRCIHIMMRNGKIETESTGQELLPGEGGYATIRGSMTRWALWRPTRSPVPL